jgi:hypothetical protein
MGFKIRLTIMRLFVCALLVAATAMAASAQTFYGGIRGATRDATGVVPGAALTLTNEATAVSLTTVTNDAGEYAFPNTPPGVYSLAARLGGYKTFERRGLIIGTQQTLVVDVALEVGEIAEQITVTGETPTLDRSSASVASLIDRSALENLPSTGRNPFLFSTTIPNVIPLGTPFFTRMQDQNAASLLSIAGAPPRANTYLLDGVPITDLLNRAAMIPSAEALEEVSVQVNTYDASFGRSGGGVFNATHRAGTNRWSGSGLLRNRPDWGLANTYFASQANLPRPSSHSYLWAGAIGGPIARGRTFVFATTEGYKTREIREAVLTLPTALERSGDFSRSVDASGRPIVIYDPRTTRSNPANPAQSIRDPFPGNIIPAERIDPVARELLRRYPLPDTGRSATRSAAVSDLSNQATIKVDHQVTRRLRTSGTFAWYGSIEPFPLSYDGLPSDPNLGEVARDVHVLALNNLFTPGGSTVYELRYGYISFADDYLVPAFDVSQLGFASSYTSALATSQFPTINLTGYSGMGAGFPRQTRFPSHTLNGTLTRLIGSHTVKAGADYRKLGLVTFEPGTSGNYGFNQGFTQGPNPNAGSTAAGDAIASLLLGLPAAGNVSFGAPFALNAHYYAAFVQDDVRVSPRVTLNLGVRYEYESGLGEANDQFTVGFDRDRPFPIQVPGLTLRGGLMYAGVDGYPTRQSDPDRAKYGPRVGVSWALGERTVLRGGYGIFWGPHQFQFPSENTLGTRGFSGTATYFASADGGLTPCASCALRDPFPGGVDRPQGSTQGLATGAGGDIHFNDQSRRSPYLHKFSVDVQHELPLAITLRMGYLSSRAERLDVGGTTQSAINVNQIDPAYLSLGPALQQLVPNPFFGNTSFGAFGTQATISRGQLLRPYPQFGNVFAHQVSAGRSRYHSFTLDGQRRMRGGWAAGANYTWSRLDDNLIGELNFFSDRGGGNQLVLDNYDLDAEFGRSLADTPHRLNVTTTIELPFGDGRRWLNEAGVLRALAGGWSATVVGFLQSGFPIRIVQSTNNSNLLGSSQRPNVVPGVDPMAPNAGEYDRSCRCVAWLNPAAWSGAAPFTFGDAPRVDPRLRTPGRNNWNLAVQKAERIGTTTLTLRVEVINLFDNPDLTGPVIGFGLPTFGGIFNSGNVARTVQLMARFGF